MLFPIEGRSDDDSETRKLTGVLHWLTIDEDEWSCDHIRSSEIRCATQQQGGSLLRIDLEPIIASKFGRERLID